MSKKNVIYIVDDSYFHVSEEIKNMTHEERMQAIRELEEEGRKEAENIPDQHYRLSDE